MKHFILYLLSSLLINPLLSELEADLYRVFFTSLTLIGHGKRLKRTQVM
jgi:hypothetical protein